MKRRVEHLLERYRDRPVLRGLIQLVPFGIGSAIDTTVSIKLAKYQEERLRSFFDELASGKVELTPELVESEDFLHAFSATTHAALNTRRRGKVRVLGRLLKGAFTDRVNDADEYEELLAIIDDLSFRELTILSVLAEHERRAVHPQMDNDLQRANRIWPAFEQEVTKRLGIEAKALAPMLVRLQRTGLYVEITGSYWDYPGGRGHLTALWRRLETVLGEIDDLLSNEQL